MAKVFTFHRMHFFSRKSILPDRESNPGLPRDRRRSSPLDYRGIVVNILLSKPADACEAFYFPQKKKNLPRAGFEPATYGCLSIPTTVHRSTNWAIEGLVTADGQRGNRSYLSRCSRPWLFNINYLNASVGCHTGDVAQMVERSLSMWEVGGSIPPVSNKTFLAFPTFMLGEKGWGLKAKKYSASSGNRTRAARVAGEHSTTEPTMLDSKLRLS